MLTIRSARSVLMASGCLGVFLSVQPYLWAQEALPVPSSPQVTLAKKGSKFAIALQHMVLASMPQWRCERFDNQYVSPQGESAAPLPPGFVGMGIQVFHFKALKTSITTVSCDLYQDNQVIDSYTATVDIYPK